MDYQDLLKLPAFGISQKEKEQILVPCLRSLTNHHRNACPEYKKILDAMQLCEDADPVPMLPAGLFKRLELRSISEEQIFKTLQSSATSGQAPSRIFLDQKTAENQQRALSRILEDFIGTRRLPMLIFDSPEVLKDRKLFSARGAGILGFAVHGRDLCYALDSKLCLDEEKVREFLSRHEGEPILAFGFTWLIWSSVCRPLLEKGRTFSLERAILIHGGGFKKLAGEGITNEQLKKALYQTTGITIIHNYYGMAEQTGSIFMECECGHLHVSSYSELFVRSKKDFSICKIGEPGLIQVLSPAAESYPGHSILTEDEGILLGEDDCPCGRKGKYFNVLGRIPAAEVRGCSDTMENHWNLEEAAMRKEKAVMEKTAMERSAEKEEAVSKSAADLILPAFSEEAMRFLEEVSQTIRRQRERFPEEEIRSFGFWCRRANLERMKQQYGAEFRLGRGNVFHIAPSNVPVMFAYSLAIGLLAGCSNTVKLSSRSSVSGDKLKILLEQILGKKEHQLLSSMVILDSYDSSDSGKTAAYSLGCDRRVIWGGDETIRAVRQHPLKPWAEDVVFSHRNSVMLLSAKEIQNWNEAEWKQFAERFYRDTYVMDQNACSSPSLLFWQFEKDKEWKREEKEAIKQRFWSAVSEEAKRYSLDVWRKIRKFEDVCCLAAGAKEGAVRCVSSFCAPVTRAEISTDFAFSWKQGAACRFGTFLEYEISDWEEMLLFLNHRVQTLICTEDKQGAIRRWLVQNRVSGVDRVVLSGEASRFSIRWDGKNLIEALTRTIE